MIAELLERFDLRADGNHIAEDFHFRRAALNDEAARSRRLKTDKNHRIFRVRQPLRQMVQNTPTGHHATRRNNDASIFRIIDLLRLLRSRGKTETRPRNWRSL